MDPEQNDTESTASTEGQSAGSGEADLLAAVNAAIDESTPPSTAAGKSDTPDGVPGETSSDDTTAASDETAAADTSAGDTQQRARDEKGRFVAKNPGDKGAGEGEAKAEGEQPPAGAKPGDTKADDKKAAAGDPVNDPIPDDVKGRTRERMEQLISRVKETTAELERVRIDHRDLLGIIQETRATPEQFHQALEYLRAVNSGDPQQIRQALKTVQAELATLARLVGEPVPGVDLLANHPDLQEAVEAGDLSVAHANEIAAAREARALASKSSEQHRLQEQTARAIEEGRQALNALEAQLKASDPDYPRKREILVASLKPVLARLPPSQWAEAFKSAYNELKLPPVSTSAGTGANPPAPSSQAPSRPTPQPLRSRQPAGPTVKAPSSLLEAINAGIEQASRG